ncbi:hypothetical protein B7755_034410 [Streptomyces sp. NBS 14/10]|uniref:hypothetical protein n=1 Tax=Streptomyces sp. NBS 14/10 TaxID=1945643 RepID=UPI0011806FAD|nr:hypothetical protein [Streptomyces sp. NBS 14/10]KAK1182784.1 hypothetical protein B7755_034410 [Streptomyces sp. NBS 14/10]
MGERFSAQDDVEVIESRATSLEVDIVVMAGVWAFERYGGRPSHEQAQILPNETGDGFPLWVVIPPYRPVVRKDDEIVVREDFATVSPAYFAIVRSLQAMRREFGSEVVVLFGLPLLGMDDPRDRETPVSEARAIGESRSE